MENSSTTSDPWFVSGSNFSNGSNSYYDSYYDPYYDDFFFKVDYIESLTECHVQAGKFDWLGVKIFMLMMALPTNAGLVWMLLSRWRTMTPSELLGVNVSVMDVLYCLVLPLDIYTVLHESSETTHSVREALFSLNIFGCPLLLTFMCLERYVAAAWPITYMILERRKHRVVLCAITWILTLIVALAGYFAPGLIMSLFLSIIISLLFLVMLLCLLGIVAVLCQKGPGEGSGSSTSLKRRALSNILAVMLPSIVAYSPVVALVPYMSVIIAPKPIRPAQCRILQVLLLFPNFGLFIGPMFYLSRVKQVTCWGKDEETPNSRAQAE
ncbi:G-protein coupled receptor 35 [Trachinotus anak]|uniref:G-protein coupled receptor 35 n=1 Tax=Trachinotus anak TaxID=443729 RepID=UPI0039F1F29E